MTTKTLYYIEKKEGGKWYDLFPEYPLDIVDAESALLNYKLSGKEFRIRKETTTVEYL